ncbi:MAG: protein kinase [Planctomycetia bacterium]|nr:protein kinase [Planctomycetia bacterium]
MSPESRCPKCGALLPDDAPGGLCPKCLVQAGFESESIPNPAAGSDPAQQPTLKSPAGSGGGFEPLSAERLAPLFPQLEILELLGKGGMGAVYKARQRGLDRLVAVKILPPEIGHDAAFSERFTREARALAKLNHPHIVAVYDFGQVFVVPPSGGRTPTSTPGVATADRPPEGGTASGDTTNGLFYIVMEYVDGVNLRQTIQSGGLAAQQALAIVPQICEALQFAHDEGIVHRDIKPENILIDKKGRVKIADFGLAKLVGNESRDHFLTGTHQVMGTLRYMAPEQMQGSREVDHRADIYSLGVVFYELLTGELPMGRFAPPSKKVQVDVRMDEIVLRALEQQPEHRYQHASEVKTDVESLAHEPRRHAERVATEPRFSRFAIAGAVWAPLFFIALIATMVTDRSAEGEHAGPAWWQLALAFTLVSLGALAPIGTTILGVQSIGHIKRSGGNIVGLPVAVADALFFPLLVLDFLITAIVAAVVMAVLFAAHPDGPQGNFVFALPAILTLSVAVPLSAWIDFLIIRAVWCTVVARPAQRQTPESPIEFQSGNQNAERKARVGRIPIGTWIGVLPFIVVYATALAALQQPDWAGVARTVAMASLCFAAVYLSVHAVIGLVRRSRQTASEAAGTEPRPWRIAMFFSLLLFFTTVFVINWVQSPITGSSAGGTAQLTFQVAGPQTEVTLNGEKVAISAAGLARMQLRPGDYETAFLKGNLLVRRSYEFFYAGEVKQASERDVDSIAIKGPLTLEIEPGSGRPVVADFTALQGFWKVVAQVKGGGFLMWQQRNKWIEFELSIMRSDVPEQPLHDPYRAEVRYAIDSAAAPRHFDVPELGLKGIYRIDGDTLTLAVADAGQPRPTEFVSRSGSPVTLTLCRREHAPPLPPPGTGAVGGAPAGAGDMARSTKHADYVMWQSGPAGVLEQAGGLSLENLGDIGVFYPLTFARSPQLEFPAQDRMGDIRFEVREQTATGFRIYVSQHSGTGQLPRLAWRARGEPADPSEEAFSQSGAIELKTGDFEVFYPKAFARPPHLVLPPNERKGEIRFTISQTTATGFKGNISQFSGVTGTTGRFVWKATGPPADAAGNKASPAKGEQEKADADFKLE